MRSSDAAPRITQKEAVIRALRAYGGTATLGQLYQTAVRVPGSHWQGTRTPFASIRRIVQEDAEVFFKIRPGLWGLVESQEAASLVEAARREPELFDHSYYQGLLLELGKLRGCETFVPAQDQNREMFQRRLGDIATLKEYPPFTYPELLKRGRTIDVTWFRAGFADLQMPASFYEVEHSTDFQNSLLKFMDLFDFRAEFVVVADKVRKPEFDRKMQQTAFKPIREFVSFWTYDELAREYERSSAKQVVGSSGA
jgi:hypothetical protein